MRPEIALIEPDIAGNVGAILRTAACLGITVHIVEPCGFPFGVRALRRAGMDYAASADIIRHADIAAFLTAMAARERRMVLMTTAGATPMPRFSFSPKDVLIMGSEGKGAPQVIHDAADARVVIPLQAGYRSFNVSVAAGIGLAEALRQTDGWPMAVPR